MISSYDQSWQLTSDHLIVLFDAFVNVVALHENVVPVSKFLELLELVLFLPLGVVQQELLEVCALGVVNEGAVVAQDLTDFGVDHDVIEGYKLYMN